VTAAAAAAAQQQVSLNDVSAASTMSNWALQQCNSDISSSSTPVGEA
jgi:hypothetical protein